MKIIDAINFYKKYGFMQFTKHVINRLGFVSFKRTVIFLRLDLNNFLYDTKEAYSFMVATKDDVQKEDNYNDYWFQKDRAIDRLKKGYRLFVFKKDDKMVYFLWAECNRASLGYFDLHFDIPNDMCYITGIYTLPEYRNKGIASNLKKEICHFLKKDGYNQLIEVVVPFNTTALKIDRRLGFREYQVAHYKRYGHIRFFVVKKFNSTQRKFFVSLFKTPSKIWKTFL